MCYPTDSSIFILGSQPRAVKKRTPRVPVSYSYKKDDRDNYIPPIRKGRKSDIDADDDDVTASDDEDDGDTSSPRDDEMSI